MVGDFSLTRDEWDRPATPRTLGRYELLGTLGTGGMATVYLGRIAGEAGFQRLYAIKVLHPHLASETGFISMFLDEARIAARLHHPNIVPIVDLGTQAGTHYVAMEYIEGCSLSALLKKHRDDRPPRMVIPIILDALAGLDAAHTLVDDDGKPMNLVHRDVSPQNVLVGVDGAGRITDFGIARAESRINSTRPGQLKGKISYMAPEQIKAGKVDCRADVFSAGIMLWSILTGRKLFEADSDAATMTNIIELAIPAPSTIGLKPPEAYDAICLRALERDPDKRYASAQEMEEALREAATKEGGVGSRREVSAWVTSTFREQLASRRVAIRSVASGQVASDAAKPLTPFRATTEFPTFTPSAASELHYSAPESSPEEAPEITVTPVPSLSEPSPRFGKRKLATIGGIAAGVLALVLWFSLRHGDSTPVPAANTATPTETATSPSSSSLDESARPVAPVAPASDVAAKPATDVEAKPATDVEAKPATDVAAKPETNVAAATSPLRREPVRRAVVKSRKPPLHPAPTTSHPAVTPPPTTTPATTTTKPSRWDPDSPVPPS